MTKFTNDEFETEPESGREDDEVGYRRPPRSTRFQPGVSGNPRGRPKGSKNRSPSKSAIQRFQAVVLEEAYRDVTVEEHDGFFEIPAMTAAMRSLADKAANGDQSAQQLLFSLVAQVGREQRAEEQAAFSAAIAYKEKAVETLAHRKERAIGSADPAGSGACPHRCFHPIGRHTRPGDRGGEGGMGRVAGGPGPG